MKKEKFTYEEHKVIGNIIKDMYMYSSRLVVESSRKLGKTHKATKELSKIYNTLCQVKNDLDNECVNFASNFREDGFEFTDCYYGQVRLPENIEIGNHIRRDWNI